MCHINPLKHCSNLVGCGGAQVTRHSKVTGSVGPTLAERRQGRLLCASSPAHNGQLSQGCTSGGGVKQGGAYEGLDCWRAHAEEEFVGSTLNDGLEGALQGQATGVRGVPLLKDA